MISIDNVKIKNKVDLKNKKLKTLLRTKNNENIISKIIEKQRFEVYVKKGIILEEYGHYAEAKYLYLIASEIAKTLPPNQKNKELIKNIEKRTYDMNLELMMDDLNNKSQLN